MRKGRQHPCPGGGCTGVALDDHIDDKRLVDLHGVLQDVFEVAGPGNLFAICSAGPGQGRKVGIVQRAFLISLETGYDFAAYPSVLWFPPGAGVR